jgi:hypothetical protein
MIKRLVICGILLSSKVHADAHQVSFVRHAGAACARKGMVEGTFGREIYEQWSIWEPVHLFPSPAMDSMLGKAASLGGNRIVVTKVTPIYLKMTHWTHGDYTSHATYSYTSITIQGVVYACS